MAKAASESRAHHPVNPDTTAEVTVTPHAIAETWSVSSVPRRGTLSVFLRCALGRWLQPACTLNCSVLMAALMYKVRTACAVPKQVAAIAKARVFVCSSLWKWRRSPKERSIRTEECELR